MVSKENKLYILNEIEKHKHILFGSFSEKLCKKDKSEAWKNIFEIGKSFGLFGQKEWVYLRDVFWPNIRKSTMGKIDNARKTGTGGGKDYKLNEIDNKVLDIIGKESPAVTSLNILESLDERCEIISDTIENLEVSPDLPNTSTISLSTQAPAKRKINQKEMDTNLRNKKIKLQVEHLELQNYKLKLEILKLEKDLDLTPSKFTSGLL